MAEPDNGVYLRYWGKAGSSPATSAYHLLPYHCLDVAAVGRELLNRDMLLFNRIADGIDLPRETLLNIIPFFLAVHDIGKFSDRFQSLREDIFRALQNRQKTREYTVRHDDMASLLLQRDIMQHLYQRSGLALDPSANLQDWAFLWMPWFAAVSGHHGVPPRSDHGMSLGSLFTAQDRAAAVAFADACYGLFMPPPLSTPEISVTEALIEQFIRTSWLIAGLMVVSDWLGSSDRFFPYRSDPMPLDVYWQRYAQPQAESAVRASGLLPSRVSARTGMSALFPNIQTPTPLQQAASTLAISGGPHLYILEDATGSGKTEAALVLAHRLMAEGHAKGIFMALPTMATADAMYERLSEAYLTLFAEDERPSLVLAHSARHLSESFQDSILPVEGSTDECEQDLDETSTATCAAWIADSRKKALLATVGVGTIDQALMGVLPIRHQSLRLLGLARHVLIVDEVHAYDAYMNSLLQRLLEFQASFGGSAILLSATLPQNQRQALVDAFNRGRSHPPPTVKGGAYPLLTEVSDGCFREHALAVSERSRRHVLVNMVSSLPQVEEYLGRALIEGRCACWVRNTVDDAIAAYYRLVELYGKDHVLLFHARFAMGDRLEIEHEVMRRFGKTSTREERRGMILVATQVVEQSLDLDFDMMVTDLAPIDLMIQRAGRLHRHPRGERGSPVLWIFAPPLTDTPDEDWFARPFTGGAYVYPKHGQLWLTSRILADRGRIKLPDDARLLIEGVFSDEAQSAIPKTLVHREIVADGQEKGRRAMAHLNGLEVREGYIATPGQWQDDSRTPTRIDAMSTTVVLARWEGARVEPWFQGSLHPWEMSQVSVRETRVARAVTYSEPLLSAIEAARRDMPGRGEGRILIPLTQRDDGSWEGQALNHRDERIDIVYDSRLGLQFHYRGQLPK